MSTISKLIVILILAVLVMQVVMPVYAAADEGSGAFRGPGRPTIGGNNNSSTYGQGGYGYRNNPNPVCPTGPGTCGTPLCPTGLGTCGTPLCPTGRGTCCTR